ncbi:MAG: tRNA (adenine-N1)-methyltransferase [Candidatus Methanoplasma sp.]|jgi:tRNA (adenine57-N1/adenine58-N1)-methyltransferase|nr:tRNA (adenine-N1)-methyltransferase [Candidatus Methanoplasma sp.]
MLEEGEAVYLLDESGKRTWMKVSFGMAAVPSLGTVDGSKLRGLGDGSPVEIAGRRFTLFRPGTVELMESLERGAQIITPKDAATILMHCDIASGKTVIEVGAGSGGMTTALLRAVAPGGRVHTIELKRENAERALRNVRRAGLDAHWSYSIEDAREARPEMEADALVMDMPDPWLALPGLIGSLRPGGRLCAYVPNANQVEETVVAMRSMGFAEVRALENIQRGMDVHPGGVRPASDTMAHTGYMVFGRRVARGGA